MLPPTLLSGLLLLLLLSLLFLHILAGIKSDRAVFDSKLKEFPGQHCAVCGFGYTGHSHGNQGTPAPGANPAVAGLDLAARNDPAAWLREGLLEHTPDPDPIDIPAYIKLARHADRLLNQLKADPLERWLLLPAAAESQLQHFSIPSFSLGRINLKAPAGETKVRVSWLMPGDSDPYLISLEPHDPDLHHVWT